MPPAVQDSRSSISSSDLLDRVTARLRSVYVNSDFVRVVASPETRLVQYKAEDGILVCVTSPRPVPKNGAGRYGRLTIRDFVVIVCTQSLVDAAGSDEEAVKAHVTREDSVCNILEQTPPAGLSYSTGVGILIEWVEGGEDIVRQMKVDPGMLVSALRFRATYNTPMKVRRD